MTFLRHNTIKKMIIQSCILKGSFASVVSLSWCAVDVCLQLESGTVYLLGVMEDAFSSEWMAYYTAQECFLEKCCHLVAALFTLVSHSDHILNISLIFGTVE